MPFSTPSEGAAVCISTALSSRPDPSAPRCKLSPDIQRCSLRVAERGAPATTKRLVTRPSSRRPDELHSRPSAGPSSMRACSLLSTCSSGARSRTQRESLAAGSCRPGPTTTPLAGGALCWPKAFPNTYTSTGSRERVPSSLQSMHCRKRLDVCTRSRAATSWLAWLPRRPAQQAARCRPRLADQAQASRPAATAASGSAAGAVALLAARPHATLPKQAANALQPHCSAAGATRQGARSAGPSRAPAQAVPQSPSRRHSGAAPSTYRKKAVVAHPYAWQHRGRCVCPSRRLPQQLGRGHRRVWLELAVHSQCAHSASTLGSCSSRGFPVHSLLTPLPQPGCNTQPFLVSDSKQVDSALQHLGLPAQLNCLLSWQLSGRMLPRAPACKCIKIQGPMKTQRLQRTPVT